MKKQTVKMTLATLSILAFYALWAWAYAFALHLENDPLILPHLQDYPELRASAMNALMSISVMFSLFALLPTLGTKEGDATPNAFMMVMFVVYSIPSWGTIFGANPSSSDDKMIMTFFFFPWVASFVLSMLIFAYLRGTTEQPKLKFA